MADDLNNTLTKLSVSDQDAGVASSSQTDETIFVDSSGNEDESKQKDKERRYVVLQETNGKVRGIVWNESDYDILQLDIKSVAPEERPIVELQLYTIGVLNFTYLLFSIIFFIKMIKSARDKGLLLIQGE